METMIMNQPIVVDMGTGVLKAGFAGDQTPRHYFPNFIGRPKHVRAMAGAIEGDRFIGPRAQEHRGLLNIRYPIEHGIVRDWCDMEHIWHYIYSKEQLTVSSEEHPVLLTETPLNPKHNRERMAEMLFETFGVPALYVSMQAVLSLYASGRTTGVVLDSGDGVTHAAPIYEGYALPHSIERTDLAGRDVTRYLRLLLRKEGTDLHTTAEFEIVRQIKERSCFVSLSPGKVEAVEAQEFYRLPDGSALQIGPARFKAPELLFRPDLIGEEYFGVHQVLAYSIQKSDMDLRRMLYENIVLSGGSTLLKGFGARLLLEMKRMAPKDAKLRISAPNELRKRGSCRSASKIPLTSLIRFLTHQVSIHYFTVYKLSCELCLLSPTLFLCLLGTGNTINKIVY
ncbi:beta centractin [Echinococcus multilocularis]|uniref:Beta centractin n=1 Tax=Echinococcus multilocularis TaxID=6211 RepID=A0A068YIV9_ECHMU|nr:beta centractin [Echinococcus multilocularis]